MITQKGRNHGVYVAMLQHLQLSQIFMEKKLLFCVLWDQLGVVYYEFLKPNTYENTKDWVDSWIASKAEAFFRRSIRMLPERWEKVVASDEQYYE